MKVLESLETPTIERRLAKVPRIRPKPTPGEVLQAFRKSPSYGAIVAKIPKAATLRGWIKGTEIAYFSVCGKTGSAKWLDIWDCDHFDGFTDMPKSVADCRAWFSHLGYTTWGSAQTNTGRVNCYFTAPTSAYYSCVARLQSYPATTTSTVECLIDGTTFGPLPFTGLINQAHFSMLSAGAHHFRIRQMSGAFFFLSVTVYRF